MGGGWRLEEDETFKVIVSFRPAQDIETLFQKREQTRKLLVSYYANAEEQEKTCATRTARIDLLSASGIHVLMALSISVCSLVKVDFY